MKILQHLKNKARQIKRDIRVLYLAYRHPETPWYVKLLAAVTVAYALSPIDLIPDFIPVIGYLDDLIILPLAITMTVKLIPEHVMKQCREKSEEVFKDGKPKNWTAALVIMLVWLTVIGLGSYKVISGMK